MFIIIWIALNFFSGAPAWVLTISAIFAAIEAIQWIILLAAFIYGLTEAKRND